MRRSTLIILSSLLLPCTQAVAGDWFVAGSLGMAKGDSSASELNQQLAAAGLNATASSPDTSRNAWHTYLQYHYTPRFGVEVGFANLGKTNTRFSGVTSDIDTFLSSAKDIHPQTAKGWKLSGVYRHALPRNFAARARLGAFVWDADYSLKTTTIVRNVTSHGVGGVYGVGGEYKVYRDTYLHADYDVYDIDGEDISILSLGISYWLK